MPRLSGKRSSSYDTRRVEPGPNRVLSFLGGCLSAAAAGVGIVLLGGVFTGQVPAILLLFILALAAAAAIASVLLLRRAFGERSRNDFNVTIRTEEPHPLGSVSVEPKAEGDDTPPPPDP